VEVAGRKLDAPVQIIRQPYQEVAPEGEAQVHVKDPGSGEVVVEGRTIPCLTSQVELVDATTRRTTRLFYSETTPPYVVRSETSVTDLASGETTGGSLYEVLNLDLPYPVLGEMRSTSRVREQRTNGKGSRLRLQFVTFEVPGGVVAEMTKEIDAAGSVVRRSTLDVTGYGLKSTQPARP
jgi:hypothetical protein